MTKFWVDTDTASDDAVALMMPFSLARERLGGISTVAGNVSVDQGTTNASYTARLCGVEMDIHAGADAPLRRALETAQHIHGIDGMGDIGLDLGAPSTSGNTAVDAILKASHKHAGALEIVTLGPLTNIALALRLDPSLCYRLRQITIMGGTSDSYGNITPVSEYNIWADPEAADVVFRSAVPKLMVGCDISRKYAAISDAEAQDLLALGTRKARVAVESQRVLRKFCAETSGVNGFDLLDPIAMAAAIAPGIITASRQYAVSMCCNEGPTRGLTILSDRHAGDRPLNTKVATKANRDQFLSMLKEALSG